MKSLKHIILISVAVMLVFSFNSCKKEGVYNPKKKITTIYQIGYFYDEVETELYAKYIWSGDLLSSIIYAEGGTTRYTYNSKNQAIKIEMEDSWIDLEYDNSKLEELTLFEEGTELCEIEFEHNGNKIVSGKITLSNAELFLKQLAVKGSLTQQLFNTFVPSNMNAALVQACQNVRPSKGQEITLNINYTWAGKNVSKVDISANILIFSISMVSEFTYDNKTNPFYNGITIDLYEGDFNGLLCTWMNKNNVLTSVSTLSMTGEGTETTRLTYTYGYDGDYPVKVTETVDTEEFEDSITMIYEYDK